MNKRGVALVFALIVVMVLTILSGLILSKTMNENNLVRRHGYSMRAFWAAEAGVSEALRNLPNSINGNIGNDAYAVATSLRTVINYSNYYDLNSIGTVTLPGGGTVNRTIIAVAKFGPNNPDKFKYAIQSAHDLCFGAGCVKDPCRYIQPCNPPGCNGGLDCYLENDNSINFADMFGYEKADLKDDATYYEADDFPNGVSGVTWVDVPANDYLNINANWYGSGVLIVNGTLRIVGDYQFSGILYVIGNFTAARGNPDLEGSIVVESSSGIDTFNGNPTVTYNQTAISDALNETSRLSTELVSWREGL